MTTASVWCRIEHETQQGVWRRWLLPDKMMSHALALVLLFASATPHVTHAQGWWYGGSLRGEVRHLLTIASRSSQWSCPPTLQQQGTPPRVPVRDNVMRDAYVATAVLGAFALECGSRIGGAASSDIAFAERSVREALDQANQLCSDAPAVEGVGSPATLAYWGCPAPDVAGYASLPTQSGPAPDTGVARSGNVTAENSPGGARSLGATINRSGAGSTMAPAGGEATGMLQALMGKAVGTPGAGNEIAKAMEYRVRALGARPEDAQSLQLWATYHECRARKMQANQSPADCIQPGAMTSALANSNLQPADQARLEGVASAVNFFSARAAEAAAERAGRAAAARPVAQAAAAALDAGDYNRAATEFGKAVAIAPEVPVFTRGHVVSLLRANQPVGAVATAHRLALLEPTNDTTGVILRLAAERLARERDPLAAFREAGRRAGAMPSTSASAWGWGFGTVLGLGIGYGVSTSLTQGLDFYSDADDPAGARSGEQTKYFGAGVAFGGLMSLLMGTVVTLSGDHASLATATSYMPAAYRGAYSASFRESYSQRRSRAFSRGTAMAAIGNILIGAIAYYVGDQEYKKATGQ